MRIIIALLALLWAGSALGQGAGSQQVTCGQWAQAAVAAGTTQLIAGVPAVTNSAGQITQQGKTISICGFVFSSTGTATGQLVTGTGANCGTGQVAVSSVWNVSANSPTGMSNSIATVSLPQGNALCATIGTTTTNVQVIYSQN